MQTAPSARADTEHPPPAAPPTTGTITSSLFSSSRITKRKLQDALDVLDDATGSGPAHARRHGEGDARPSPLKRANTSIYSSLAKYGIHVGRKPGNKQESGSTLSRLFNKRSSVQLSRAQSTRASPDTPAHRPSISHPFALAPNTSLSENTASVSAQFTFAPPASVATPIPVPLYRPASAPDFLDRLSTFKLSTYRDKPPAIDAVAAARCGWRNQGGKDRLSCNVCGAAWIVGPTTGMTRDAASALIARHVACLVDGHKSSCPWRLRQCDPNIYRLPLKSSSALTRDVLKRATALSRAVERVAIKHPLTSIQLDALVAIVNDPELTHPDTAPFDSATQIPPSHHGPDLSHNAVVLALFGWEQLAAPMAKQSSSSLDLTRNRSTSRLGHTRSPSGPGSGRSTPVPHGQVTVERKASGSVRSVTFADGPSQRRFGKGREEGNALSAIESSSGDDVSLSAHEHDIDSTPLKSRTHALRREATSSSGHSDLPSKDEMVYCSLCQRRVGLWAFLSPSFMVPPDNPPPGSGDEPIPTVIKSAPARTLDVLREHRSFCPYVIRTTPLTIPSNDDPSTEVEGWKAILGIILRSKRGGSTSTGANESGSAEPTPGQTGAESAVNRVKHSPSGSRDLLRYVKGLLA
ncbi:C3HC zinc finger-like protein [Ceratobasidium sp. AG-Ba]|nr:C3HC zinc finger-like protein [Ceratobasidium sp. AG-Ba]